LLIFFSLAVQADDMFASPAHKQKIVASAGISCVASAIPFPSVKAKQLGVMTASFGAGAAALIADVGKQYRRYDSLNTELSFLEKLKQINWSQSFREAGAQSLIAGISAGVTVYAASHPKFINFSEKVKKLSYEQIEKLLKKSGFSGKTADDFCRRFGVKRVKRALDFIPNLVNKVDNVENAVVSVAKNEAEILDEIVINNNVVTENAKKFWAQHEMNVTDHLETAYGKVKVGQQITVDVYIQGRTTPVRCRIDNLIDVGNGNKFRIADSKSSLINDLSKKTPEQLLNNMSTANQKIFYDALKNGTVTQIKPAGQRATDYFSRIGKKLPPTGINVEKSIDFFVNDVSTSGYKIFKKTLTQ